MNILPFVLSFIVLLGMISMSLFQSTHHTDYLAYQQTNYQSVQRALQNKLERKAFHASLPPSDGSEKKTKKKERKHYISPRLSEEHKESSKLHIPSLFIPNKEPNLPLEKILSRLILILYQDKNFFFHERYTKEELSTLLVKKIVEQGKKKASHLTDLYPEDPELKAIFYKMLKSKVSFGDYISLEPSDKRNPICFKTAPIPLLEATFGEKITSRILEKEKNKYFREEKGSSILKEEELKEVLSEQGFSEPIHTLLQFHYPTKEKITVRESDQQSGVTLSLSIKRVSTK